MTSFKKTKKQVCVIGLGHVGLPMACTLAVLGYSVLGIDTDDKVLLQIQSSELSNPEPHLQELLQKAHHSGNFKVSTKVSPADYYIVAVPTLIDSCNRPDISHLNTAMDAILPSLQPYNLLLIESTCPIGTTEKIARKVHRHCPEVHVAYCPERILPGNILFELINNDRVVGGIDEKSTVEALTFYKTFIQGEIIATDAKTAEAVKLAENTYRDINIAYANELSMIAGVVGVDVNRVIQLANRHPRVQILNPGSGVGGHCIGMDPWYLVSAAPERAGLIVKARETNLQKTEWVIQKIRETIQENRTDSIACLGLTYKPDVADYRESPAMHIVEVLEKETKVFRVDPYISDTLPLFEALSEAKMIVFLVAHSAFLHIPRDSFTSKIVLDFVGVMR